MNEEQQAVVTWMRRVMSDRGWTADEWAKRAKVAPSTVSRSMKDDYPSTTSLPVLHRLAQAAGVLSPVAFLARTARLPNVQEVGSFLAGYLASSGTNATPEGIAEALFDHFKVPK